MTTQLQRETRKSLSRRPFQVGRNFNRRIFADLMYEDGVYTLGVGIIPHPDYGEHRVCLGCGKQNATVMRWPGHENLLKTSFTCCGWPA